MGKIERLVRRLDARQQQTPALAFPVAVVKKFGDDRAGGLAALLAYYGFLALFPLLLLLVTLLGLALRGNASLQRRVLRSALSDFPIIGDQIRENIHSLRLSGVGLVIGILGLVWGSLGVTQAGQHAMAQIWNVEGKDRPPFFARFGRGLLFIAHLGESQVIEVDVHAHRVVRTINNLSQVHGVLVVPKRGRVYATATGTNQMVALDEDTGAELGRAPTGNYPDGLAYDPQQATVWTTNESGGSETIIDAATYRVRGTVDMGGEAGNVAYDPGNRMMLVDVQSHNSLAVIDPARLAVVRQVPLPGCQHDHGLALDPVDRLAFVACDANATLLSVDLTTWHITGSNIVGADPDVLAYDPAAHRLYVAAESGDVTTLDNHNRQLTVIAREHVGEDAHVVAVDPTTGHSYYPLPTGPSGSPTLLEKAAP